MRNESGKPYRNLRTEQVLQGGWHFRAILQKIIMTMISQTTSGWNKIPCVDLTQLHQDQHQEKAASTTPLVSTGLTSGCKMGDSPTSRTMASMCSTIIGH